MQLDLRSFSTLVGNAAAAVQGSASQLIDLTVGSTLRALLEANAAMALWLQWLILQVLQMTRAATSNGSDLDSWMADFSLQRLPAVSAVGVVQFARFAAMSAAIVPVGTIVRTSDGTQSFTVTADATNPLYSVVLNGYTLAAGVASVNVPVAASVPGVAANVQVGTVSLIAAALPGVDTVSNTTAFQGGLDAEADSALRLRFQNFLSSRARATPVAVGYAISSLQQGLQYSIAENQMPDGSARLGSFVVTVDDGSGAPSAALIAAVAAAVETVRPVGSSFGVLPPTVVAATISLSIAVNSGAVHSVVAGQVAAAIAGYVNALPIGVGLPWSRVAQLAYQASSEVSNVTSVLVNGAFADLAPTASGVVKAASVTVN